MTREELSLPWTVFAIDGLAPWRLVVKRGDREVPLLSSEALALAAAAELDRVRESDIDALLAARRRARKPWTFESLVSGAGGLSMESAPGELSVADALRRAGLEFVRTEVRMGADEGRAAA